MRKDGVIDSAAHDAQGCRRLQSVGVFVAIERDDGESFREQRPAATQVDLVRQLC
jgi:hypothetical protein